ncbi:Ribbon-helix-helix protein, copG family [Pseudooceanicola antarcticus]|uniref:Ribbon-helix-helix protein, CopG family n=1 Tax=Pseudooceanicola antarcticus TaxID=1247613 RepID=A0A285JK64_9RHOB|nr:ribbon-helix-helix protein, CopG family [Pseudooceanicola antarcticus]PJE26426.1 ribbon-helix-helix protein, CopG family [Pseudooceanicola antarcticus]SNY59481.1 Ribbon-helix-helix protein, copG family [Pseudooceanicola antarcticus]
MPAKKKNTPKASHRLSVSLTEEQHTELLEIADKNKVSVAWVVREAIERLLRDEQPLFHVGQER